MFSHSKVAAALALVLLLAGTAGAQASAQDDVALASSVRTQLSKHYGESAAASVKVAIKDGAVSIEASELTPAQRAQALGLIRSVPGVTGAIDVSVGGSDQIVGEKGRSSGEVIGEKGRGEAGASAGSANLKVLESVGKANVVGTPGFAGPGMSGGMRSQPAGVDGTPAGVAPLPGVSPEGNDNDNVPGKNTNVRVVDGATGGTGVASGTPLPGVSPEGNDNGGRDGNDNGGGPPVSGPENSRALTVGGEQGGSIVRPPVYGKSPDNDNKAGGGIKIDVSDAQLARDAQAMLGARFGAAAAANLRVTAKAGVVRVQAMAGNILGRAQIDAALQHLSATREVDVP